MGDEDEVQMWTTGSIEGPEGDKWKVSYLHDDCTICEACADVAVENTRQAGAGIGVWHDLGPNGDIQHMAEVIKE